MADFYSTSTLTNRPHREIKNHCTFNAIGANHDINSFFIYTGFNSVFSLSNANLNLVTKLSYCSIRDKKLLRTNKQIKKFNKLAHTYNIGINKRKQETQ